MSTTVWAYVDPGTGSIILQVVVGSVLGASFFMRNKLKRLFSWTKYDSNKRERSTELNRESKHN